MNRTFGLILTAAALTVALVQIPLFFRYHDHGVLLAFIVGPTQANSRFDLVREDPQEDAAFARRFSAACVQLFISPIVAALLVRPLRMATPVSLALRTLVFVVVAALALVTTAAYYRAMFGTIGAPTVYQVHRQKSQIALDDLPLVRIPVIAAIGVVSLAALMRSVSSYRKKEGTPNAVAKRVDSDQRDQAVRT